MADSSKPKQEHVHDVFQQIAPNYDRMNNIISFNRHKAWRKFAMRKMAVSPGDSAIDLCCGTCDWTLSLAEASKSGPITGLDFSQAMLDVGRKKIAVAPYGDQIKLIQGNAMELPFADNSFDYATIGFGLRNVPDLVQVLQEMRRVVKPGGMVVCLEVSKPTIQPFKGLYYFYFDRILPVFGKVFAKSYEQYKWLPESLKPFPGRKELAQTFRDVGLKQVEDYPLTGGVAALHIGIKEK